MSHLEGERARAEAAAGPPSTLNSAARARLWAGLNRYLATETEHERKAAKKEQEQEAAEREAAGRKRRGSEPTGH